MHEPPKERNPTAVARGRAGKVIGLAGLIGPEDNEAEAHEQAFPLRCITIGTECIGRIYEGRGKRFDAVDANGSHIGTFLSLTVARAAISDAHRSADEQTRRAA